MKRLSWLLSVGMVVSCLALTGCPVFTTVPNVVGQTLASAGTALSGAGLTTGIVTEKCTDIIKTGLIISETPAAGQQAPLGTAVAIVISSGPCYDPVPNVVGETQGGAVATLTGAGFTTGTITHLCSDTVPEGVVISQNPVGGTLEPPGTAVDLVISTGPCNDTRVPNVVGQTQTGAGATTTGGGLTTGTVTQQCSNTVAAGLVITQSPVAGSLVAPGSAVSVVLSTGLCNDTVPNVVGLTPTGAGTTITGASLTVGTTAQDCSDTVAAGLVISQTPAAGQQAPFGSTVALVVSVGPCDNVTVLPGNVPLETVWIPGGPFLMGSPNTEPERDPDEGPQHSVTVSGFWMSKYELTMRQWEAVMGPGTAPWIGKSNVSSDPDSPAVYVSWNDAQTFLTVLNTYTGQTFRLSSEAEWEYACRAGTSTRFYWGDDLTSVAINNYAWWNGNAYSAGQDFADVVGGKTPNAFGLYDMSGNVVEWVQDWWHGDYTGAPTDGSAWEVPANSSRVIRGGSWLDIGLTCRSAARYSFIPSYEDDFTGFRLAK